LTVVAYDYSDDVLTAQEMIAEFGRAVTFGKMSETPNPTNPLHGPVAVPTTVSGVMACFVEPSSAVRLGASSARERLWKDATQIMLVAPDGTNEFDLFEEVTDLDGSVWSVGHTEKLQPGPTVLLYFIGVRR
jgi:hypothetical protein